MSYTNATISNSTIASICSSGPNENHESSSSSSGTFVTGVIIAVLGSTGEQLGLTLWKLAENRVQTRREDRRKAGFDEINVHGKSVGSPAGPPDSLIVHLDDDETHTSDKKNSSNDKLDEGDSPASNPSHNTSVVYSEHALNEVSERGSDRRVGHSWTDEEKSSAYERPSYATTAPSHEKGSEKSPAQKSEVVELASNSSFSSKPSRFGRIKTWCIEKEAFMCLLAVLIFSGGNGLNFVALGLIQESIVTLIGAWALVINIITAKFWLSEELSYLDGISVLMIIVGIALSILGSQHNATNWYECQPPSSFPGPIPNQPAAGALSDSSCSTSRTRSSS
jgi:hypothetical protein